MLITHARIITCDHPNQIIDESSIYIEGGKVIQIGSEIELREKYGNGSIVNAHSQYVLPGAICAHTHFYGAFARGMYIPGEAPRDFPEILEKLWWPLDRALDERGVYYSALVCLIDAIKHGTTLLFDHHASPNFIDGSLDVIAEAVKLAGVRASLCYEVTDRNGMDGAKAGIQENIRFYEKLVKQPDPLLSATFGLHASLTLSEATLSRCRELAPDGMGFHFHAAEHEIDEYDSLQKCGQRVIDRLQRHQMLGSKSIAVHAVHVDAKEIGTLAETQTFVTHQPRSNMNNGVGLPRVEEMLRAGIPVCIGNDGFSNAMWEEWKSTYLAHKLNHRDPRRLNGGTLFDMAIYNNAALANTHFKDGALGVIKPGAAADLIFVEYYPYTPLTVDNLPWHMAFGFHESMVTTTIVAGEVLMQDRKLTRLDEEKITNEARIYAPKIWEKYRAEF